MPTPSEALAQIPPPLQAAGACLISLAIGAAVALRMAHRHRQRDTDRPPSRAVENGLVALGALFLAGVGFAISFESVSTTAAGWAECGPAYRNAPGVCTGSAVWARWPWALPLGIDSSILILDAIDLWLVRRHKPLPWLRLVPRAMVGVTIFLNIISARTWGDRVAHAALILNYAVVAHVLRHAIEAEESDGKPARVDAWQWVLAPRAAYWTWRIMRLEKLGWEAATAANKQRALTRFYLIETHRPDGQVAGRWPHRVAVWLRARCSGGWSYVPAADRVRFRMGDYTGLGRVAREIAVGVAGPGQGGGNGVAAGLGNGVAGSVAAEVAGGLPGVSGGGNESGSGGNVVLLEGSSAEAWLMAAEGFAVAEAGKPQRVATARRVAEELAAFIGRAGREPSNKDLGNLVGISHTSAGNYRRDLRPFLPVDEVVEEEGREAVGES